MAFSMGLKFVGRRFEKVEFRGVDLAKAREAAGLSEAGLAARLRSEGITRICGCAVCQQRISKMESAETFEVDMATLAALKGILGG